MKHVLVVDDDVALRDVVARVLREEGYLVTTAATGAEALHHVQSAGADGVLLDLVMPEMDGETFLRTIRADPRLAGLPVAICSTSDNARRIGREHGVEVFIPKPFELEDLLDGAAALSKMGLLPAASALAAPKSTKVALARQLSAETQLRTAALRVDLVRAEDRLQRSYAVVTATSACLAKAARRIDSPPAERFHLHMGRPRISAAAV